MKNIALCIVFISVLAGCATIPKHQTIENASPTISTTQGFSVSGAIAAKNQHHAWTATFYWTQHSPHHYHIQIYGLVGTALIDITYKDGMVTYREGKKILHAKQAEDLLAKETGIRIPVNHLYYWIKGQPAPGAIDKMERSPEHDITRLQQAGFTLIYKDYHHHYPYKIRLQGSQLMVKIIVKEWEKS
ncbi:MAG TPA: lipoprotein insertase outer membrane protein LolB [Legionellaceae bacterium]|nr:lipoprotein insertase outer membrane protein LolB [Legionellaceae bacterium]